MNKETTYQYVIAGRLRSESEVRPISQRFTNKSEATRVLNELRAKTESEIRNRACATSEVGGLGISTEYHSDYDLVDLKLMVREVSPWEDIVE